MKSYSRSCVTLILLLSLAITLCACGKKPAPSPSGSDVTARGAEPLPSQTPSAEPSAAPTDVEVPENTVVLKIGNPNAVINGVEAAIDSSGSRPYSADDVTMLPVRSLVELAGGKAEYNGETQTIKLLLSGKAAQIIPDSSVAFIDGEAVKLQAEAKIIDGTLYLPTKFVAGFIGASVGWDGAERSVTLKFTGTISNSPLSAPVSVPPPLPDTGTALFDETYWHISDGPTIAGGKEALFHADGTYSYLCENYTDYGTGAFTYADSVLKCGDLEYELRTDAKGTGYFYAKTTVERQGEPFRCEIWPSSAAAYETLLNDPVFAAYRSREDAVKTAVKAGLSPFLETATKTFWLTRGELEYAYGAPSFYDTIQSRQVAAYSLLPDYMFTHRTKSGEPVTVSAIIFAHASGIDKSFFTKYFRDYITRDGVECNIDDTTHPLIINIRNIYKEQFGEKAAAARQDYEYDLRICVAGLGMNGAITNDTRIFIMRADVYDYIRFEPEFLKNPLDK
ncbi:MAG: copper amine oxidase N-terminal domain-containing protein [Oscillospiraceae bacterium]|jgi:hypothetical protein|nr:copper amine oxidase N-terminal domain-containing protein [Oscillospiraceae bacterium]